MAIAHYTLSDSFPSGPDPHRSKLSSQAFPKLFWVLGGWPWGHMGARETIKGGPREDVTSPRTQAHIPHAIEPLLTLSFLSPCGIHTRNDLVNSCGCSSSQSHGRVTPSPVSDDTKWCGHETRRPAGKVMVSDFEALKITSRISNRGFKGPLGA